jgi:hypothetical protein
MPPSVGSRGTSSLIADLLLMVLAVSAGAVIYSYTMGYLGGLGGGQAFGRMSLDSAVLTDEGLTAYIRNLGGGTVVLDRAYVDSTLVEGAGYSFEVNGAGAGDDEIAEGETGMVTIQVPGGFEAGRSYEFRLVDKGNAQLTFTARTSVAGTGEEDWLDGWGKRVKMIVDHNDVDSDLSDFPVLVYLSSSSGINGDDVSFVFDELGGDADRMKIAVTEGDGLTQCYVEIEGWDDGGEEAWLWVRVPSVNGSVDTVFYLYYDSGHADNTEYVGDPDSAPAEMVWDSSFLFVSHMGDDPDDSHIRDSTSNNHDGSKRASGEPLETTDGQIDDAQGFDGVNDYAEVYPFSHDFLEITTVFWMKTSDNTKSGTPISCSSGTQHNEFLIYDYRNFDIYLKGGHTGSTGVSANDGNWHQIAVTWRSSDGRVGVFKDGTEDYSGTSQAGATLNLANIMMGQEQDALHGGFDVSQAFLGVLDNVRISNVVRSDAWIKASFEGGRDHFIDFSSEEIA